MEKIALNAQEVLENIDKCISELTELTPESFKFYRHKRMRYHWRQGGWDYGFVMGEVFDELSIFDWWRESLSMSQLKQMRAFVQTAIKLGFKGYVCFKVGASGCSHGMWAHTDESTTGYSPNTGDVLYHSFRTGDNYYDACIGGKWLHDSCEWESEFTLTQIKKALLIKGATA